MTQIDGPHAPTRRRPVTYAAAVIGATGAVGGALVSELLASDGCTRVVALVRRQVDVVAAANGSEKLQLHVIDFTDTENATRQYAAGCDVAFCTMGIGQPRKATHEEIHRVDVEYAGAFARGAAAAGVGHISLLSSVGADSASRARYLQVKGEAEGVVAAAGVARTSLFRPSLLVTPEIRYGLQDTLTQALFPLVAPLLPSRYHQIRVEALGRAMRLNAETLGSRGVEVLHYPECVALLQQASPDVESEPVLHEVHDRATLDAVFGSARAVLYKHSTRCPVSTVVIDEVVRFAETNPEWNTYVLKVIEHRDLSDAVAERLGVRHASPQAFVLKEGRPVWHASHGSITAQSLRRHLV